MAGIRFNKQKRQLAFTLFVRGVVLGLLAMVAWFGLHALPDTINPFSPVELTSPVGPLTNVKLRLLQPRYEACLATIKRRGMTIERAEISSPLKGCGAT